MTPARMFFTVLGLFVVIIGAGASYLVYASRPEPVIFCDPTKPHPELFGGQCGTGVVYDASLLISARSSDGLLWHCDPWGTCWHD